MQIYHLILTNRCKQISIVRLHHIIIHRSHPLLRIVATFTQDQDRLKVQSVIIGMTTLLALDQELRPSVQTREDGTAQGSQVISSLHITTAILLDLRSRSGSRR